MNASGIRCQVGVHLLQRCGQSVHVRQHDLPSRAEAQTPGMAIEQFDTQGRFKLRNALADRRWGQVALTGRRQHGAVLRHGGVNPSHRVVVSGGGTIGLVTAAAAIVVIDTPTTVVVVAAPAAVTVAVVVTTITTAATGNAVGGGGGVELMG